MHLSHFLPMFQLLHNLICEFANQLPLLLVIEDEFASSAHSVFAEVTLQDTKVADQCSFALCSAIQKIA